MSFLDATGLGTFWGKLKNYFVSKEEATAPVTGLTDILTPVNLLPNSDFSRSGGYDSTITIDSISPNSSVPIDPTWSIYSGPGASNVTVVKNVGLNMLTISGTLIAPSSGNGNIQLRTNGSMRKGTYTYAISISNASSNFISGRMECSPTHTTIESILSQTNPVGILSYNNVSGIYYAVNLYFDCSESTEFTIQIHDPVIYEGEFLNPPCKRNLELASNSLIVLKDNDLADISYRYSTTPQMIAKKWFRIFKFNKANMFGGRSYFLHLILSKGYFTTNYPPSIAEVKAMWHLDSSKTLQTINSSYGIECIQNSTGGNHSSNMFSKFRFAHDENDYYIEAYPAGGDSTTKNNLIIALISLYSMDRSYSVHNIKFVPESVDGTNDTQDGQLFGYRIIGTNTYVTPS